MEKDDPKCYRDCPVPTSEEEAITQKTKIFGGKEKTRGTGAAVKGTKFQPS